MVSVVEKSKALIVTDTGTAHIASAVNTTVFCLIGPTPEEQTGPYKTPFNEVHIINAGLSIPTSKPPTLLTVVFVSINSQL